jgi:small-conductance mechanosensitive channel
MQSLQQLANRVYYGDTLQTWVEALLIFLVIFTVLPLLRVALERRLKKLPAHENPTTLELMLTLLTHTTRLFVLAVALYAALKTLTLPRRVDRVLDFLIEFALWTQVALWGGRAAGFLIDRRVHRSGGAQLPTFAILRFVSLVLIWALAVLMLLSNLGINITALVTSLGIGGVAFALAIQNVLGDVLASLAIAFDKPFQIGDELHIDDINGIVEQIGIKSTRLRSIDGEQIIISNSQILQARLHNFGRATEERATLVLTLAFDTPIETLRGFPALVQHAVSRLPHARLQRCYLRGLGGAGFEFEVGIFTTAPSETPLTELRQRFMLALLDELGGAGLGFLSPGSPVIARKPPPESVAQHA